MKERLQILTEILVLEVQLGNKEALGKLVKLWNKKLLLDACHIVKDYDIACDLLQDTWETVFKKIQSLRDPSSFHSWFRRILYNKCMDHFRNRHEVNPAEYANSQEQTTQPDMASVLKKLEPQEWQLIRWHYYDNLSIAQVSEILKIPEGTVKSRLYSARQKIKVLLKEQNNERS